MLRNNWLQAYDFATATAAITLNDYARDHDPFAVVGERNVAVEVLSVVRASEDSFEIRWRESTYRNGSLAGTERYTGILTIVIEPPTTEAALRKNPLGIYVHGLAWSQDLNPGEEQ